MPPEQRVAGLLVLTLATGALMLVSGLLRAGSLVRFISNAVMVGFMAGVSVLIILGQLTALTGFSSTHTNKVLRTVDLGAHLQKVDVATTLVGLVTVAFILVLQRTRLRLYAMVTALVVVSAGVAALGLTSVPVVGISRRSPAASLCLACRTSR